VLFNDMLKNVSTCGTPGCCEWHPRVLRHPGREALSCTAHLSL